VGNLSEHFSEDEFRCKDNCGKVHVDPGLIYLLEKALELLGRPIVIHSGFRCPEHNKAVGGTPQSAHLTGEAADIVCAFSADRYDLLRTFLTLGVTRIGIGSGFIHIDVSTTLPQRCVWLYSAKGGE
jgi:zinc D-Ala-D-Ala carboxypeptidase